MRRQVIPVRAEFAALQVLLEALRDAPVQGHPERRGKPTGRDLPDVVVAELQPVTRAAEHPVADELLDALGRLALGHICGPLDKCEVELAADHGGHRDEAAAPVGEALQAPLDELAHPRRQGKPLGCRERLALTQRMHHLDHYERVAVTDAPRILGEVRDQLGGKSAGREGLHEGAGIGT